MKIQLGSKKCIRCGYKIDEKAKFCSECGAKQHELKVGDIIQCGTWNGKPIDWVVLDVQERKQRALVMSVQGLFRGKYHEKYEEITWEICTLREYLNGDFFKKAFSADADRKKVHVVKNHNADNERYGTIGGNDTWDKIFLLSIDEYNKYLKKEDVRKYRHCSNWWWLRTPGASAALAATVYGIGALIDNGNYVYDGGVFVRPAFYYNLES